MKQDIEVLMRDLPVQALLDSINPEHWRDTTIRQDFPGSAHRETHSIFLRGPTSFLDFFSITSADYPRLREYVPVLMPIMRPLLELIECQDLGRVILVRLPAGARVLSHFDSGAYAEHYSRFHVCLSSNEGCHFKVGDSALTPKPGEAFIFNHRRPHRVVNEGSTERIHLIVDAVSPNWSVEA